MNKFNKKKYKAIIKGLLQEKKLKDFLLGKGELEIVCIYADMPTDPDSVYSYLKAYYDKTGEEQLWIQVEEALLEMCKEASSIWLVPHYIYSFIYNNRDNKKIDISKVKKSFQSNIKSFEKQLTNNRDWVGAGYKDGLMGDIKRMRKIFKEKYGFEL